MTYVTLKMTYSNKTSCKRHVLVLYVIKYLNINQHDDSYITLDKNETFISQSLC